MNNRQHIQKKHPSQSTYTPVQNLYQTRAFDIQQQPSHSSSGQENVDLDADHEQSQYNRYNLPYIPVNAPGTEPPPPIQTQLNSGEPTNYYQQGSADVPWYNRPTYPNIPVNAPGTEPPPPIQTQLNSGEPTNYYQQGSADVPWYNRPTYPNIPVNAPGTEPPPPIQTQLNSGEPTNYYQQGSADVPWYNRPTYPNIPVNAPGTEPPPPIQTKLTIGEPGDKYEQEADQVASQVVQQINSPVSEQSAQGQTVQREEVPEEEEQVQAKSISDTIQRVEEEEELQGKSLKGEMAATPNLETSIQGARGSGQPLDENIRQPMEKAFGGVDFSQVKVHNDAVSDQLNQSIQARAFTTGQDVFFRGGEYDPGSRGGQELIAHELTHVVQQNGSNKDVKKDADLDNNKTETNQQTGISNIQRDLISEDQKAKSQVDSLDVVYEIIAHKLAYEGIDSIPDDMGDWLDKQGYQRNWLGTVAGSGLFCGLIMPKKNSDKQPVLAFKGTDFSKTGDVMADADPVSVGFTAFKLKQKEIEALISQAGEKVVVTGHSLGGALAQHAASAFTGSISKVVTFQAPGISQEQVRQFNNNVKDMKKDERPEVVHHLATGDIVDLAGGKHIGGSGLYTGKGNAQFYLHHLKSGGPMNHTKFLLQDEAFKQQQQQVGMDDAARKQVGLNNNQIGENQNVGQYNNNPFAGNQFIFERGRELAAPGAALLLGGKELYQGGKGLTNEGVENWKQGGFGNKVKGVGKMIGGGVGMIGGGRVALAGGRVALAGVLAGGAVGATAVGAYKTVEGIKEGISTGAKIGSSPGRALVSGGVGLAKEGKENWQQGGFMNKTKGFGKMIGGGLTAGVGGLTAGVGGTVGSAIGSTVGGLTGIPRALWKRWKRE